MIGLKIGSHTSVCHDSATLTSWVGYPFFAMDVINIIIL